jgi:predicted dehydrogenase
MSAFRVGLIGFGYAGRTLHAPLLRAQPAFDVVAVASRDAGLVLASLGTAVSVCTPAQLVVRDDIDLVVIASPNDTHYPLADAALRAGRHVVVDKPFTVTLHEARALAALATERAGLLSVFHNRRWDSDYLTVRRVLAEGRLGRVTELVSHFDRWRPQVRARWREGSGPGAGLWLDLGPHLVDQALQLFGPPDAISLDRAAVRDNAVADDWFHAILRWSRGPHAGLRVQLHASALAACPGARFAVHGTQGSLVIEGLDAQEAALKAGAGTAQLSSPDWGREDRHASLYLGAGDSSDAVGVESMPVQRGDYPAYYAAIANALRGLGDNPVPALQAVTVQAVLEAGERSADQRREQELPASA